MSRGVPRAATEKGNFLSQGEDTGRCKSAMYWHTKANGCTTRRQALDKLTAEGAALGPDTMCLRLQRF
jgi:hypothetical protein